MGIFVSIIIISMVLLYTPIVLPEHNQAPQQYEGTQQIQINTEPETETQIDPPSLELEAGPSDTNIEE